MFMDRGVGAHGCLLMEKPTCSGMNTKGQLDPTVLMVQGVTIYWARDRTSAIQEATGQTSIHIRIHD